MRANRFFYGTKFFYGAFAAFLLFCLFFFFFFGVARAQAYDGSLYNRAIEIGANGATYDVDYWDDAQSYDYNTAYVDWDYTATYYTEDSTLERTLNYDMAHYGGYGEAYYDGYNTAYHAGGIQAHNADAVYLSTYDGYHEYEANLYSQQMTT